MLRAVSAGAAFLLFLGGRRVSNAGMSFFRYSFAGCARQRVYGGFSVFFCGLREEKVYLANLSVLLRGLYADHVKRLGFFCAPFADGARQRRGCYALRCSFAGGLCSTNGH